MIDFSLARLPPYAHQRVGADALAVSPTFALFDEPGVAKSKQVIDAACHLFVNGAINRLVIVTPSGMRGVWADSTLGELRRHLWESVYARITNFHARQTQWEHGIGTTATMNAQAPHARLNIVVTGYEYLRYRPAERYRKTRPDWPHLNRLLPYCDKQTWIIFDESSEINNWQSDQTRAAYKLRQRCGRVTLLNGTPIELHLLNIYSQARVMDARILDCPSPTQFKMRYAIQEQVKSRGGKVLIDPYGKEITRITGWTDVEDVQRRLAPYVLRRLKKDCLDLPAKLPATTIPVPLSASWKTYQSMRRDSVAWLQACDVSQAPHAITKIMRLSQITSGHLGGVETLSFLNQQSDEDDDRLYEELPESISATKSVQFVGREKLDATIDFVTRRLDADPNHKLLIWCCWRAELERTAKELRTLFSNVTIETISGGQKTSDRQRAVAALDPRTAPSGPVIVVGNPAAGGRGLTLTACHDVLRVSSDRRTGRFLQAEDRVHRPGQTDPVSYTDLVAVGPSGQKTIDAVILQAHRDHIDVAMWTTSAWVTALSGAE